jgi:hypothetical protein
MAHAGQPPIPVFRVPQHHGKNLGGRPRNAWDSNRRAVAVALYFWSTLSMEDKMKCLNGPNFEPGWVRMLEFQAVTKILIDYQEVKP